MEAEGCWVFFLNERLKSQVRSAQLVFAAYAVAKNGRKSAVIYDFRPNLEQMRSYVELWSLYALGKQEQTRAALESFRKRFPADGPA